MNELTWTDRAPVHGCDVSCWFFDPDVAEDQTDFVRRNLPVLKSGHPTLLFSEQDRKNFVAGPLIAQPDAVLRHGLGLLCLEYKSQGGRLHRQHRWQRDIPCKAVLQVVAASIAVSVEMGKTVAPVLRCHNALYFIRPTAELVARMWSALQGATEYWGKGSRVRSSDLAAYLEPWVLDRFTVRDAQQLASSEAGLARHEEMLRR